MRVWIVVLCLFFVGCPLEGPVGPQGEQGDEGNSSYVHVKYSNDGGKTFTGDSGEGPGDWIGFYKDNYSNDSNDVSKYTWTEIKGEQGTQGAEGPQGELLDWTSDIIENNIEKNQKSIE